MELLLRIFRISWEFLQGNIFSNEQLFYGKKSSDAPLLYTYEASCNVSFLCATCFMPRFEFSDEVNLQRHYFTLFFGGKLLSSNRLIKTFICVFRKPIPLLKLKLTTKLGSF